MNLDIAKAFDLCFPAYFDGEVERDLGQFDIEKMPYKLQFKDISGYYQDCFYCEDSKCGGCMVPFSDSTVNTILNKNLNLTTNDTFYSSDISTKGKELQLQIVWH